LFIINPDCGGENEYSINLLLVEISSILDIFIFVRVFFSFSKYELKWLEKESPGSRIFDLIVKYS
jgi:hypothetical protein